MYDIINVLKLGILILFIEIFIVTNYEYKKEIWSSIDEILTKE